MAAVSSPSLGMLGLRAENSSERRRFPTRLRSSSAVKRSLKKSRSWKAETLDESAALTFWQVLQFFHQWRVIDLGATISHLALLLRCQHPKAMGFQQLCGLRGPG